MNVHAVLSDAIAVIIRSTLAQTILNSTLVASNNTNRPCFTSVHFENERSNSKHQNDGLDSIAKPCNREKKITDIS